MKNIDDFNAHVGVIPYRFYTSFYTNFLIPEYEYVPTFRFRINFFMMVLLLCMILYQSAYLFTLFGGS